MNKTGKFCGQEKIFFACVALWLFFALTVLLPVLYAVFSIRPEDFALIFTRKRFFSAVRNTAIECVCSTVVSVFTGYVYAYGVVRGNLPFKKFFSVVPVVHLVTPPFVGGLSFILLFGRQGFFTKTLLGLDVTLYGFWGLLLSQVLCFFPLAYLICCQTLNGINPSIEQAARSLGAGKWKIFKSVTLPLSFTGVVSSALFIAVSVLSDFGNPLIVGGRFNVLAVEIYTQLTGWLNIGTSAALGLVLLVPSVLLFVLQHLLYRKNALKFATIGGKNGSGLSFDSGASLEDGKALELKREGSRGIKGRLKSALRGGKNVSFLVNLLLTVFCSFFALLIVAQLVSVVLGAFQKLWGINPAFTLEHIKSVFVWWKSLFNSLFFAFVAAIFSTFIAAVTVCLTHRSNLPLTAGLDVVCQIPSAIPGTLFGLSLAYVSSCVERFIHLELSGFLIILAMTVSYLPFSYRICSSTFSRLKISLDEAARSLGAGRFRVLKDIILPLSVGGLFSSGVYDFARGVGTVSSVIFLVSFNTGLASIKILNLAEQGDWGKSAALALVLTVITFIILGAGKVLSRRFEAKIYEQ